MEAPSDISLSPGHPTGPPPIGKRLSDRPVLSLPHGGGTRSGVTVRVVAGVIDATDATTRLAIPTPAQARWPPFDRVSETIATPRRRFPAHQHSGVEVLTYVIEGSGSYALGKAPPDPLGVGSTMLLTAPTTVSHAINPGTGQTIHWFSVVARLPSGKPLPPRLQTAQSEPTGLEPEGTMVRGLVGPGTPLVSESGLECASIKFREDGSSFHRVGHDRVAVCYAFSGRGTVDNELLNAGEAALVDDAAGVALHGRRGFHVVLASAPRG